MNAKQRLRILVVDNDLDSVQSTAVTIKDLGHEARYAISASAAVDIARRFRPNVVVLNPSLPDRSADELASDLKREPGLEATRFVGALQDALEQP